MLKRLENIFPENASFDSGTSISSGGGIEIVRFRDKGILVLWVAG